MKVKYINQPSHPVTITVIGAGGNGSQMIQQLGRINHALRKLGHPGLYVILRDHDRVSESNIGRQLFTEAEIGEFKAVVLISRINRFYGTEWQAETTEFKKNSQMLSNIIITCTDNRESRMAAHHRLMYESKKEIIGAESRCLYWLDMGNTKNTGQVILGSYTCGLPTVVDRHPDYFKGKKKKEDNTPSCSLAEALSKQDLFINTFVTNVAAKLLWEMFRQQEVNWCGAYINLDTLNIKKIRA